MRIDRLGLAHDTQVHWLDVAAETGDQLLPASVRVVEAWRKKGMDISALTVRGDPFWMLQETTLAPALLAATNRILL